MATLVNLTDMCSQASAEMKIIFVRDVDDILQTNFDNVVEEMKGLQDNIIDVIEPEDCFEVDEHELANKRCIFVFDKFDSAAFKYISEIKNVYILGIKVIMAVIHDNLKVPDSSFHIHNLAMKDMILCFASIGDPEKKSRLKKLIGFMGGYVTNSLRDDVTHLVTEDLFSKKYQYVAKSNGKVKIMLPIWIEEAWKLSQDFHFKRNANDSEFIKKFQLKIFYKLVFSSTGLENEEKKNLEKIIEDNGGEYSHIYKTSTVNILLMRAKDIGSAKHKASVKHSIHCIDPKWILDSVEAGYAVNLEDYVVKKNGQIKSSTPTKNTSALGRFNFDNTVLSDISDITTRSMTIDETQKSTRASTNLPPQLSKVSNLKPSTSFRSTKSSGAVANLKNDTFKKPTLPTKKDDKVLVPSPPNFEYSEDNSDESLIPILFDKIVCIYGYERNSDIMQVTTECEKVGAKLVDLSYNKTVDYVITSADVMDIELPKLKYKKMVNDIWLEECVEKGRCIEELKFYHHPLFKPLEEHQVLKDEIFVCSNYETEKERPFIRLLVKTLGGICKEALSRAEAPILICPSDEGKKYAGARNWGLTVLRAEWLLKCYEKRIRYDEEEYLVGDTKASRKNVKRRDSIIPSSQDLSLEIESPARKPSRELADSPHTPKNNVVLDNENEANVGNISWLLEGMPTPQRTTTKEVLLEQQKKNKVSPRTKLLKDLLQTPGNAQKTSNEYVPSPIPENPQILEKPADGNYGLVQDASPASQWYYKRKMDALDDQYIPIPENRRKALKEIAVTPPFSHNRHDFFKKRLSDYDSPDPRKHVDETQGLYMARIVNMSNEASKFLNFEDTHGDGLTSQDNPQDSDIQKLDELLKRNNDQEEKNYRRFSNVHAGDHDFHKNKNIIDFNPKSPDALVRWSNTQQPNVIRPFSSENVHSDPDTNENEANSKESDEEKESPINLSDNSQSNVEYIFAISSGNNGEEKQIIGEKIEKLGGKLADQNFTHLVMAKISKSSKFFSALASGKRVVHSSYLDECLKKNKFVETDSFEFGNPNFNCNIPVIKEPVLFEGPYRCRQLVQNNPEKYENGLFTGMKFIVIANAEKLLQFIRVIESGGGTIINEKPEFKVSVLKRSKVDYCLVENLKSLTKKDLEVLQSCNVKVKNVKFIYEFLLNNLSNSSM